MKCPFRLNEIHNVGEFYKTKNIEFGECYKEQCPYWGTIKYNVYGNIIECCRKVNEEVG